MLSVHPSAQSYCRRSPLTIAVSDSIPHKINPSNSRTTHRELLGLPGRSKLGRIQSLQARPKMFDDGSQSDQRERASSRQTKMAERREKKEAKKAKTEIAWPAIKPKQNLQVTRFKGNDLFVAQNFLTPAESKAFIKAAESRGFTHQGSLGPTKGEAYRDNDRISVNDPVLAQHVWDSGLSNLFNDIKIRGQIAVGLNPNIRFYRYKVNQRFGRHIDESVELEDGKCTHYTLLIYLSGGPKPKGKTDPNIPGEAEPLVGGETVFYNYRNSIVAEVAPIEGMALFHIHGNKCMLHEARNVTKGVKYVFRSDVIFA